jgi:hypothetical protein
MAPGTGGLRAWPSAAAFTRLNRRLGIVALIVGLATGGLLVIAALGYDFSIYRDAAASVSHGGSPYANTLAIGAEHWGPGGRTFVYPPFLPYLLSVLAGLSDGLAFGAWTIAGALFIAFVLRRIDRDVTVRRVPLLVLGLGYLWMTVLLGQVNLFVAGGIALAIAAPRDRDAGLGLALASLIRPTSALLGLVLLADRRPRALAWCLLGILLGTLLGGPAEWRTYAAVAAVLAGVPAHVTLWQSSLVPYGGMFAGLAVIALAGVAFIGSWRLRDGEARLVRSLSLLLVIVLGFNDAWMHWLLFALVPLLLWGHAYLWSRRALLAFLVASWVPLALLVEPHLAVGIASAIVGTVVLAFMAWHVVWAARSDQHSG